MLVLKPKVAICDPKAMDNARRLLGNKVVCAKSGQRCGCKEPQVHCELTECFPNRRLVCG